MESSSIPLWFAEQSEKMTCRFPFQLHVIESGSKGEFLYEFPPSVTFTSPQEITGAFNRAASRQREGAEGLEQQIDPSDPLLTVQTWALLCVCFTPHSFVCWLFSKPGAPICPNEVKGHSFAWFIKRRGRPHKSLRLFFPLALACHANEQQDMWLSD